MSVSMIKNNKNIPNYYDSSQSKTNRPAVTRRLFNVANVRHSTTSTLVISLINNILGGTISRNAATLRSFVVMLVGWIIADQVRLSIDCVHGDGPRRTLFTVKIRSANIQGRTKPRTS